MSGVWEIEVLNNLARCVFFIIKTVLAVYMRNEQHGGGYFARSGHAVRLSCWNIAQIISWLVKANASWHETRPINQTNKLDVLLTFKAYYQSNDEKILTMTARLRAVFVTASMTNVGTDYGFDNNGENRLSCNNDYQHFKCGWDQ